MNLRGPARYGVVAATAFAIGSATVVGAAAGGLPIGTLIYAAMINGVPTTPCSSTPGTAGPTTTCAAVVDATGQLSVSDADTHRSLGQLHYDSSGNLKVASQGPGTVSVSNLPTDASGNLRVSGTAESPGRTISVVAGTRSFGPGGYGTLNPPPGSGTTVFDTRDCRSITLSYWANEILPVVDMQLRIGPRYLRVTGIEIASDYESVVSSIAFLIPGTSAPMTFPFAEVWVTNATSRQLDIYDLELYCAH